MVGERARDPIEIPETRRRRRKQARPRRQPLAAERPWISVSRDRFWTNLEEYEKPGLTDEMKLLFTQDLRALIRQSDLPPDKKWTWLYTFLGAATVNVFDTDIESPLLDSIPMDVSASNFAPVFDAIFFAGGFLAEATLNPHDMESLLQRNGLYHAWNSANHVMAAIFQYTWNAVRDQPLHGVTTDHALCKTLKYMLDTMEREMRVKLSLEDEHFVYFKEEFRITRAFLKDQLSAEELQAMESERHARLTTIRRWFSLNLEHARLLLPQFLDKCKNHCSELMENCDKEN